MTLEEIAGRIENPKPKNKKGCPGFIGRCPSCAASGRDSKGEHLWAFLGHDEYVHLTCIADCGRDEIQRALGITDIDRCQKSFGEDKGKKEGELSWRWYGPGGYVATHYRYIHEGKKGYAWRVEFDKDGQPTSMIDRVSDKTGKAYRSLPTPDECGLNGELHILYPWELLSASIASGKTIYITEGERGARLAHSKGIAAFCGYAGAGKSKWLKEYTELLAGAKEIVIVADRDKAGDDYAKAAFTELRAAGFQVRVVRSKTVRENDDLRDHLEAGYGISDLAPALDLMPPRGLKVRKTDQNAQIVEMDHIIDPYFPRKATVLLDGKGGTKKSFFVLCIAAALSNGWDPINKMDVSPVRTLYIHKGGTEESPTGGDNTDEKLNTIFRANGGVGDLHTADIDRLDEMNCTMLLETISDGHFGLVVFDYLFQFFEGLNIDINNPSHAILICRRLLRVAVAANCCIVPLRHHSKGGGAKDTRDASELGSGTNQWHDGMRGHLVFRKHIEEPHRAKGVIVVTDEKGDLLNPQGDAVIFSRRGNEIFWEESVPNPFGGEAIAPQVGKGPVAEDWMRRNLIGQLIDVVSVNETLKSMGISLPTVKRARAKLNVKTIKNGATGGWWLTIEDKEKPDPFAGED